MNELTDFLLARIGEDEAVAREAVARNGPMWSTAELSDGTRITGTTEFGNPRSYRGDAELWDDEGALGMFAETAAHIARWDPARVLAKCAADRLIVESEIRREVGPVSHYVSSEVHAQIAARTATPVMRILALPYADHPDYDERWRP